MEKAIVASETIGDMLANRVPQEYTIEIGNNERGSLNNISIQNALRYLEELGLDYGAPLALGLGQTIAAPYITRLMDDLLELRTKKKVLEVGTGTGYQATLLADAVRDVYTIDTVPSLVEHAQSALRSIGYENIHFRLGDGYEGWIECAPYDAIVVTVSCSVVPPQLLLQLEDNGVLIIPIEVTSGSQYLFRIVKSGLKLGVVKIGRVCFPPLKHRESPSQESSE
ncbi:MAG: methyltransferase domain-containing protein [Planctomycetes bacterium]|nr:methyltransferase domain-containing protein [Planctomycetota bacterium]